ncbi:MAG: hypothetical protein WC371_02870 [Parachlamydiales bacterium]
MLKLFCLFSFFLVSCSHSPDLAFVAKGVKSKEKKLKNLKEKISEEELAKEAVEKNLRALKVKLSLGHLKVIEKKLSEFSVWRQNLEKDPLLWQKFLQKELPVLFLEERETLIRVIEESPEVALQAQEMLNAILRLITELSSQKVLG